MNLMARYRSASALRWECCFFGGGYGATCGALYGIAWMLYSFVRDAYASATLTALVVALGFYTPVAMVVGAMVGWFAGALVGSVAGMVTSLVPRRGVWRVAVALGVGIPWLMLASTGMSATLFALVSLVPGLLAAGVCVGLLRGRSRLPGVERLATMAHNVMEGLPPVRTGERAHEPVPSHAPVSRGDELSPVDGAAAGAAAVAVARQEETRGQARAARWAMWLLWMTLKVV